MRPTMCIALGALLLGCKAEKDTDETTDTDDTDDTDIDDTDVDDTDTDPDGLTEEEFREAFVAKALQLWLGMDYTYGGSGQTGIDGAGTVYATLQAMNYTLSPATADGLVIGQGTTGPFAYTMVADATHKQLSTGDWSTLETGDLLVLDYDFDNTWDHVAIFTGRNKGLEGLTASDYFDEVVTADLSDYNDPLPQDLTWSNTTSRRLDYASIEATFGVPD
ncbi:MAG: hypothetical protein HN348_12580 [Proteobacteria bacterium]|jgi:hypothetical protein|nr:hypothetical protein [Pseudomonadota bacterium]